MLVTNHTSMKLTKMDTQRTLLKPRVLQKLKFLYLVLKVLILLSVLQLLDSCDALMENDNGTCVMDVPVQQWKVSIFKGNCPKGYRGCSSKEKTQKYFNPKSHRCCVKKVTVREKKTICCAGWEYVKDKDLCIPQCECENGKCVPPNKCECELPLILDLDGTKCITPVCNPPCVNSQCGPSNTCSCNPGFTAYNATHCMENCKAGFKNDPITLECVPICYYPCMNSQCTGPNICTCLEGFSQKDNFTCVPQCTPTCGNGECISPNVCKCDDGYSLKDGTCFPVCEPTCKNGDCIAPNTCACYPGYETDQEPFECYPKCRPKCRFDTFCMSPNNCQCLPGYEVVPNATIENRCKPLCDNCEHGSCEAPNTCKCDPGYFLIDNVCKPQCEKMCLNGICSAPNKCTCNKGYEYVEELQLCDKVCDLVCINSSCSGGSCLCNSGYEPSEFSNICQPSCDSCEHGTCVAPNICNCDEGYHNTDGHCAPICNQTCVNGYCSSPQYCSCDKGFKRLRSTKEEVICYKPCPGPCGNGTCNYKGQCECHPGFELDEGECSPMTPVDCETCQTNCTEDVNCQCFNGTPCFYIPNIEPPSPSASAAWLASFQLTWTVAGAVALLLVTLLLVVMVRLYRRPRPDTKVSDKCGNPYGSVIYTVPDTLIQRGVHDHIDEGDENTEMGTSKRETTKQLLLTPEVVVRDDVFADNKSH